VRELEHVLGVREEPVLLQQRAEFADLVEEEIGVPVLAVELVALDIREHAVRQRDHLVVGAALFVGGQQLAVVGDELPALGLQLRHRPLQRITRLHAADVTGNARERHGEVVVPGAVVVIEAVARH
jgi:hypothetical protein